MSSDFDVCIVGTGASGGILAYSLAKAGLKVAVLEQGGVLSPESFQNELTPEARGTFGISPETVFPQREVTVLDHPLYADQTTRSSSSLSEGQFKQYQIFAANGLQNLWSGVSVRFSPDDFQTDLLGLRGRDWPLEYRDLEAHYSAVERLAGVCGTTEGRQDLPDGEFIPPKPLRPADLLVQDAIRSVGKGRMYAIPCRKAIETRPEKGNACRSTGHCYEGCRSGSVYKFSSHLLPEIAELPHFHLFTHSKVVRLGEDPSTRAISEVGCLNTQTRQAFRIAARYVVLSAGAIETPRILLNSPQERTRNGAANRSGLVGRYLQDNPSVMYGSVLMRLWFGGGEYDIGYGEHLLVGGTIPVPGQQMEVPIFGQLFHDYARVPVYLPDLQGIPRALRPMVARKIFKSTVGLVLWGRCVPQRGNGLSVSSRTDRFGVPQVDVHYGVAEQERRHVDQLRYWARKILRRASGLVSVELPRPPGAGIHYGGTCRMSRDPTEGVVDADLKAHDHPNLFLCDGSVLPVLPSKHCTLTIMALAHRLGEHIKALCRCE